MNQRPHLFHRSVRENVRFAQQGATDEDVIEACKKAEIHDSIMSLDEGYDTIIQEDGAYVPLVLERPR